MSTHNICFHGEIRKISILLDWKKKTKKRKNILPRAMVFTILALNIWTLYSLQYLLILKVEQVHWTKRWYIYKLLDKCLHSGASSLGHIALFAWSLLVWIFRANMVLFSSTTYTKVFFKKKKKNSRCTYQMMLMLFFSSDFLYKSI